MHKVFGHHFNVVLLNYVIVLSYCLSLILPLYKLTLKIYKT